MVDAGPEPTYKEKMRVPPNPRDVDRQSLAYQYVSRILYIFLSVIKSDRNSVQILVHVGKITLLYEGD